MNTILRLSEVKKRILLIEFRDRSWPKVASHFHAAGCCGHTGDAGIKVTDQPLYSINSTDEMCLTILYILICP